MQFNVAQLMKERTGADRKVALREALGDLDPEIVARSELAGNLRLMRTIEGVLVTGQLRVTLELECDRCLTAYSQDIAFELEDEFKPVIDIASGASVPISPDDVGNLIDDHHILDVQEVVRQRLLLSKPLHALCRPDCRGLCVHCGANLNEGRCSCAPETVDPRWAALLEVLRKP